MLGKTKRYLEVTRVLLKYNLIPELYRDLRTNYISNPECTCTYDLENRQTAVKLREAFEELGPTFIKMGQTMSKRPDLVPQPYVIEMANLQDKVKPIPFEEIAESLDLACVCEFEPPEERKRKKRRQSLKLPGREEQRLLLKFLTALIRIPLPAARLRRFTKEFWKGNRLP